MTEAGQQINIKKKFTNYEQVTYFPSQFTDIPFLQKNEYNSR